VPVPLKLRSAYRLLSRISRSRHRSEQLRWREKLEALAGGLPHTSDPRHFGRKTLQTQKMWARSVRTLRTWVTCPKCPLDTSVLDPKCPFFRRMTWVRSVLGPKCLGSEPEHWSGAGSPLTAQRPPAPRPVAPCSAPLFFPTPAHRSCDFLVRCAPFSSPLTLRSNAVVRTSKCPVSLGSVGGARSRHTLRYLSTRRHTQDVTSIATDGKLWTSILYEPSR